MEFALVKGLNAFWAHFAPYSPGRKFTEYKMNRRTGYIEGQYLYCVTDHWYNNHHFVTASGEIRHICSSFSFFPFILFYFFWVELADSIVGNVDHCTLTFV